MARQYGESSDDDSRDESGGRRNRDSRHSRSDRDRGRRGRERERNHDEKEENRRREHSGSSDEEEDKRGNRGGRSGSVREGGQERNQDGDGDENRWRERSGAFDEEDKRANRDRKRERERIRDDDVKDRRREHSGSSDAEDKLGNRDGRREREKIHDEEEENRRREHSGSSDEEEGKRANRDRRRESKRGGGKERNQDGDVGENRQRERPGSFDEEDNRANRDRKRERQRIHDGDDEEGDKLDNRDRRREREGIRDDDGKSKQREHSRSSDEEEDKHAARDRKRERERLRDDDRNRRRDAVEENSESSDEEEKRGKRDRRGERDRRNRHDNGHRDRHNHRQRESEEDRYRHRDRHRHSRHDSDDDEDYRRRSQRNKERENKSDRRDNDNQPSRRSRDDNSFKEKEEGEIKQKQPALQQNNLNGDTANLGRSGGVYIPPFKLARMMKETEDKSSVEYQRLTWDALRKSINGLVNKVNATNIKNIIPELFAENLIRGRGLFCRSCMKSQMASPGFTDVFAAFVAVVNTKFPEVGDLLLRRIVLQLKRAYKRNDKPQLLAAVKFIAHLVNQQVAHEIIALELLTVLLENPTDDSVEVAVGFVTECGSLLQDLSPKGLHGIFERFRGILHEGEIDKRVQFLIEGLFAIRKAKFQGYPAVRSELDLVEHEDQLTHEISLQDEIDPEITLDIFKPDPQFLENEKRYEELKKTILGEESDDEEGSDVASGDEEDDDDDDETDEEDEQQMKIRDETETNLINLRRTIYLTIMSSVDFEEAGHKLLKIKLEPGQEMELCVMLLECCSQERTYLRYYGLLGQRFCMINKVYQENFDKCFVQQYSMIHRLETNKLRNVAKFFAHLLGTDALPWHVLAYIRLTEEDTTSSSRIFIKILFQELSEHLGIRRLNERLSDPTMLDSFESIFPRDNPKNTRFSINFFTSIGLGGITENLREYLKNMPRLIMQQQKTASDSEAEPESGSSSSSESGGSSSSDSETASSDSESNSSGSDESERRRKRRRR
ncbi:Initiation factor eIF-4 gamma [Theobroma cacao]|nr:Initiation factor eIF-4 gamma [Theobroma cacao]